MYETILVTLDASPTDHTILSHIIPLAKRMNSKLVLLHVADSWAARTYGKDAIHNELTEDEAYLRNVRDELKAEGIEVETELAYGEPANEIVRWVKERHCDLIAMSTHGHRLLGDILFGTTAQKVQHMVSVPVLMLRQEKPK
ncbi:MAG: universal stress protein [Phycisphaerae bacterium]|nr:universal stress protein [Phycisphaerae bacterium]